MPMFSDYDSADSEHTWVMAFDGYDPQDEGHREGLFAVGNGYFVTRAAAIEATADEIHYPGTYRAGLYNRLVSQVNGETVENESLVNLPNWLALTFRIDGGDWFSIDQVEILSYQQSLHLRSGVLRREIQFRDRDGRQTKLHEHRFVSMAQPHLAGLHLELIAENWSGELEIRSAIDGRVINNNVKRYEPYNKQHLEPIATGTLEPAGIWLNTRTSQSRVELGLAARTQVLVDGAAVESTRTIEQEKAQIGECIRVHVNRGAVIAIEKIAALYTSRDPAIACCIEASQEVVLTAPSFTDLLNASKHAWERLWMRCDLEFEPVEYLRIARLHIFHILQTFSPHTADLDAGLPARGWHGEGYRGHIFWDEVFVLPFLIYRFPAIAREILLYRYRRLNAARALAHQQGYRGAMYPWRSASTGGEETPRFQFNLLSGHWTPDHTQLQRHISAIVAHTVWEYYIITNDIMFLCDYGAELLIEVARFWVSFATYHPEFERYEILGVMGPDEYHTGYPNATTSGINNNSYTNLMAVWTLCRAQEVLDLLPASRRRELYHWLKLSQEEIDYWDTVSRKMRVVFDENGSLSQYEGFDRLQELDWQQFDHERINWVLEAKGDDVNRYQVAKQADLAMLFFLFSKAEIEALLQRLGYTFDLNQMQQTLAYHLQRTSHESSLSRFVYAGALSQLELEKSWQLFTQSLITDVSGASSDEVKSGIHLGAMAGTLYVLQHHYLGLKVNRGRIYLNPSFPTSINHLRVSLQLQSNDFQIEKIGDRLNVAAASTNQSSVSIIYHGEMVDLQPGISLSFALNNV
ncbi:glycoside hydrolase family 65 protein [Allocoleopsis franciscana]|uniref:Trehalose/maltose hydrolase or phosphorylase n=1 Tax=Allocoleopsis franciscana PCC 7113 TaxID=1173027 RepID=K9WKL9_9CYAN|nr:glycoside hydrolase family 65 protein [Allocoleopsis franciscana]AFZ20324.1 trehalose/maltose hydrolase or phosphorylase [Allocoleopsis franciscana PCC 7113]